MKLEQITKVSLMLGLQQVWVETNGILKQNKTSLQKLYRLSDRCWLPRNPDVMSKFDNQCDLYDQASEFFVNS